MCASLNIQIVCKYSQYQASNENQYSFFVDARFIIKNLCRQLYREYI